MAGVYDLVERDESAVRLVARDPRAVHVPDDVSHDDRAKLCDFQGIGPGGRDPIGPHPRRRRNAVLVRKPGLDAVALVVRQRADIPHRAGPVPLGIGRGVVYVVDVVVRDGHPCRNTYPDGVLKPAGDFVVVDDRTAEELALYGDAVAVRSGVSRS